MNGGGALYMLLAKTNPTESIQSHLKKSATISQILLSEEYTTHTVLHILLKYCNTDSNNLINFIAFCTGCHDIGKCSPLFQSKLLSDKNSITNAFNHAAHSQVYLRPFLSKKNIDQPLCQIIISCAEHHHGPIVRPSIAEIKETQKTQKEANEILEDIYAAYPFKYFQISEVGLTNISTLILGITMISDWLASFRLIAELALDSSDLLYRTKQIVKESGFANQKAIGREISYADIFNTKKYALRPLQQTIQTVFEEMSDWTLLLIEDSMGSGKTEASFYALSRMSDNMHKGIAYALPTMSTTNLMYSRFQKFLGENREGALLHSMRNVVEDYCLPKTYISEESEALSLNGFLQQSTRRGTFEQYFVCTIDQIVSSILNNKYYPIKLLSLVGKTIVIDEIHSYDCYTTTIIQVFLEWCKVLDIKVIIISATLTDSKKQDFIKTFFPHLNVNKLSSNYPLITAVKEDCIKEWHFQPSYKRTYNYALSNILNNITAISKTILAMHKEHPSKNIVYFANSKKCAQSVYKCIRAMGSDKLLLVHSNYHLKDRLQKEKQILNAVGKNAEPRETGLIVISTQILECSLDVDFDYLFTDIAPYDILCQRLGRLYRFPLEHRANTIPTCTIFIPYVDGDYQFSLVYDKAVLDATLQVLQKNNIISIPEDIRKCVNKTYEFIENEDWVKKIINDSVESNCAKITCIPSPTSKNAAKSYWGIDEDIEEDTSYYSIRNIGKTYRCCIIDVNCQFDLSNEGEVLRHCLTSKLPDDMPKETIKNGTAKGTVIFYFENGVCHLGNYNVYYDSNLGFAYERSK